MEFEVGYLLALVVIGLSFLGFMLAMMIDEVNRFFTGEPLRFQVTQEMLATMA